MLQTSKLLIDDEPLQLIPALAVALGNRVDDAVVLQQLHYWLRRSTNQHDGRKWVYNTYQEWVDQDFPFYTANQVRDIFRRLRRLGVVIAKAVNEGNWDRRYWYTIDYDALEQLCRSDEKVASICENRRIDDTETPLQKSEKITSKRTKKSRLHLTENTAETTTDLGAHAPTTQEPVFPAPLPPTESEPARKDQDGAAPSRPSPVEWDDIPAAPVEARDRMTVQQAEVGAWGAVMGLDVSVPANAKRVGNMLIGLRKSKECQPTVEVARDRFGRLPPADGSWNFYTDTWQGKRGQFPTEREINQYWSAWTKPQLQVVKPARATPARDEPDGIDAFFVGMGAQPDSTVIEGRVIRGRTA